VDLDTGHHARRGVTNGQDTWSARCVETRTPGAAGGPGKRTGRKASTAPRSDPTNSAWTRLAGHQACAAHLLRDLTDAEQSYPKAHWPVQAQRGLRGLIHAWHQARDAGHAEIPAPVGDPLLREFRAAVRVGLAEIRRVPGPRHSTAQLPGRDLLEFCRDHQDDVLRFATDTRVWPTNNISERDLRPTKTQQKIDLRTADEDVTRHRLDIRSYIDTVRKHGLNIITALRGAVTGDPWHPPALAPT